MKFTKKKLSRCTKNMEVWLQEVGLNDLKRPSRVRNTGVVTSWFESTCFFCLHLCVCIKYWCISELYTCTSSIDRSVQKLCKPQQQRSQAVTDALPFARAHQIDSQSWGILHLQQAAARLIARRFGDSEVTWQSNPGTNLYPTMPPKLWQGICCLTPIPDSDCFHLQVAVRLEWWEYLKAHFQNFDLLHWRRNWMTLEVFVQRHLVLENSHRLEELEHLPHGHGQQLVQCPRPG